MRKNIGSSKGYTLTELAVTLGVMGILAMLAIPSFRAVIPRYRVKGDARLLATNLNLTRLHAISRNREYKMFLDQANDAYVVSEGNKSENSDSWTYKYDVKLSDDGDLSAVSASLAGDNAIFRPNGTLVVPSTDTSGSVEVEGAGVRIMIQITAATGRVNSFRWVGNDWKDERFLKG